MTQLLVNEGLAFVANNNLGRRATGQQLFDSGCTRDLNRVRPHRENARMTPVSQKKDLKFGMPWCRRGHGACPRPRSSTMAVPPHRPDQQHENSHELSYCQLLLLSSLVTLSICGPPQDPFQRSHPKHHLPRWFVRFHRRCPIADQIRLHYPPFRYRTRICIRIPLLSPLMLMMPGRRRMTYLSREKGEAKEAKDIEIQERDAFRLAAPKLFTKCCCCAHALFTLVESTRPNFWTIQR